MKSLHILIVFSIVIFYLSVTYSQIIEEIDLPIIENGTDSSVKSDGNQCFPPCRKGFFCHEGQCISKCNPPCPDGMDCWDDAGCHPRTTSIRKALNEIAEISRVYSKEELVQGAVIRTNKRNARVRILDTIFEFDGEIFLNVPNGEYNLYIDAPGYFENQEDLEVRLGTVETIYAKLRPFQINAGIAFGASIINEFSLLAGDINIGLSFSSLIYTAIAATYIGPFEGEIFNVTDYRYLYRPDTLREVWKELMGIGLSCGYLGIAPIAHRVKFIPQIEVGYWKYDDQTYFLKKYSNGKTEYLDDLEQHTIERYFIRPTLAVRVGRKAFNFIGRISAFVGTGTPIVTFMAGFEVDVPK